MSDSPVFQWPMLLLPLAALCYFELLRHLDRLWANRQPLTDEEVLAQLARLREVSEYEVFHQAGAAWTVGRPQVEDHFKAYLKGGALPHYVRDYLRRHRPQPER